jgi:hypothetical protein
MPADERDPQFERALAHQLRGGSAGAGCPDAETLAAYHERNLSLEEMAQWKQHISACAACQEVLSLVETTEKQLTEDWETQNIPVLEATAILKTRSGNAPSPKVAAAAPAATNKAETPGVTMLRRRPALVRWAIPLGAVAAGVLVWMGIHEQRALQSRRAESVEMAQNRPQPAPAAASAKIAESESKAEPQKALPSPQMQRDLDLGRADASAPKATPQPMNHASAETRADHLADETINDKKDSGGKFAYAPAPAVPSVPAGKFQAGAGVGGGAGVENKPALAALPPPAPPTPGAVTQTVEVMSEAPAVVTSDSTARAKEKVELPAAANMNTNAMMMKQGVSSGMVQVTASGPAMILTPSNLVYWRMHTGGIVELTTNAGKKWKSLKTGAASDFTAGSAPSEQVCWIAGKSGTLVLTTDRGRHWTRITTPISGDLAGVHASDEKHASIWDAVSNQSYETSDGGATWKQAANP